ncbi:cysteine-rich receptor-like protein kinase 10 isoform X2 [Vigna unguiculata]|uniref:cysteine-rich receptor-like protein kinase 10 isoform X2 n=1 Tax=Vigna unguiculata TaxID=3917 RepID=UPI001015D41B|nr:cysteine-rich receptor-like protein kinase 10 isoform X2 [Vigna unguiculata]
MVGKKLHLRSICYGFHLLLLLSFRPHVTKAQTPIFVGSNCQNTTQQPLNSVYQTNLEEMLRWASSDAATSKGYNYKSIGNNSPVYGLYDCRGDVVGYFCQFCVSTAAKEAPQRCPNRVSAMVWYDFCVLRYSNESFYGTVLTNPSWHALGEKNISNMEDIQKAKQGGNNRSKILIISFSVTGSITVLCLSVYWWWCRTRKDGLISRVVRLSSYHNVQTEETLNSDLPTIPLITILQSTDNFSEVSKLGEGGFGPVYKGILPDGRQIAVKRLSKFSGQGSEEFNNEVMFIAKLQHRNLVRLLACCLEENEKILVYEYLPNKSLDFHLFDNERKKHFDWKLRLSIINGIARGILYLHEDSRLKVIHRDLKASNVLLDPEMNPKISDFGLARTFEKGQNQANTKRVMGTYGYMAPEYAMEGLFSVKSDVFSFGVLVLEIICGRKNSGFYLSEHGQTLLLYAWRIWCERKCLQMMDPTLEKSFVGSEVERCIQIGLLCVQEDAKDRPTMSDVVVMLASDAMTLLEPKHPPFSVGRTTLEEFSTSKSSKNLSINDATTSITIPR